MCVAIAIRIIISSKMWPKLLPIVLLGFVLLKPINAGELKVEVLEKPSECARLSHINDILSMHYRFASAVLVPA